MIGAERFGGFQSRAHIPIHSEEKCVLRYVTIWSHARSNPITRRQIGFGDVIRLLFDSLLDPGPTCISIFSVIF